VRVTSQNFPRAVILAGVPGSHNGLLHEVSTTRFVMLAGALAGVILVALSAGPVPARRVSRVDPVIALRAE
jgi:ABC-type lipoprotein release transport system permease subunit